MLEFLLKKCTHDKITPQMHAGYCPDCGEYVENHWYITRCACCGKKQKCLVRNGRVVAIEKYCNNCGSSSFNTEELEELDISNINYAVVVKETVKMKSKNFVQTWVENATPVKLIPSF